MNPLMSPALPVPTMPGVPAASGQPSARSGPCDEHDGSGGFAQALRQERAQGRASKPPSSAHGMPKADAAVDSKSARASVKEPVDTHADATTPEATTDAGDAAMVRATKPGDDVATNFSAMVAATAAATDVAHDATDAAGAARPATDDLAAAGHRPSLTPQADARAGHMADTTLATDVHPPHAEPPAVGDPGAARQPLPASARAAERRHDRYLPGTDARASLADAATRDAREPQAPATAQASHAPGLNAMPMSVAPATAAASPALPLSFAPTLHEASGGEMAQRTLAARPGTPEFAPALGAQISLLARDGVQEARLQLNPAELGPVWVHIAVDGPSARVDFHAEVAATRAAIESSLPELAGALRESGLTLTGGGVFQQTAGQGRGQPQDPGAAAAGARRAATDPGSADARDAVAGTAGTAMRARRGLVDMVA